MLLRLPFLFLALCMLAPSLYAKLVEYDLTITEGQWAPPGRKPTRALLVNGGIPGPTIRFKVGDVARIRVHNRLKNEETSIHWHGLLLPNKEDGVPGVTTPPILPGKTHTFEFPIKHAGTYWYHSHTAFQEQSGVFGSIVIEPVTPTGPKADREEVVVLSDWSRENPGEIMRSLARGTEWYEIKKGTAQSLVGAIKAGALKEFWERERSRMPAMDISDIAYDAFLANGTESLELSGKPGETVKLRFINAASATYFYLESSTGPLKIVAADGPDVVPIQVKRLLVGMAETYDILITIPPSGKWELRATAQDGSGHASVWLGNGGLHRAPAIPKADNYRMDSHLMAAIKQSDAKPLSDKEALAAEPERPLSPYERLRSPRPTTLPAHLPRRTITLRATGDMERYVWSFNGKTFAQDGVIPIKKGEVIRIEMINDTMMHHPLHLHGHFFRILFGHNDYSPLKHTIDLPPMARRVVEFEANDEGDWLFHCHLLYHMHAGMTRIFSYQDASWQPPADEGGAQPHAPQSKPPSHTSHGGHPPAPASHASTHALTHTPHAGGHDHDPLYPLLNAGLMHSFTDGRFALRNSLNDWYVDWEAGYRAGSEVEVNLGWRRYIDTNRGYMGGLRYTNESKRRMEAFVGYEYRLPYLVWSHVEVDTRGSFRVGLEKELAITSRLNAFGSIRYDLKEQWEWRAGARFIINKPISLIGQYHSKYGVGLGIGITY